MTKRPSENLPEPNDPFARWFAGIAVGFWALGVQDFPTPWNKWAAILSPGVGYVLGHALDLIIHRIKENNLKRTIRRDLLENTKTLDDLRKDRQRVIEVGADDQIIKSIDTTIFEFEQTRLKIIERSLPETRKVALAGKR
jgi:hypothetical protein